MRRIISILTFLISVTAFGQHGIAFYHLKNATFQNTHYNPAHFPHGKVFIGLPVISGVNAYFNNRFSYNDLFNQEEGQGLMLDIDNVVDQLGIRNQVSTSVQIDLLHIGVKTSTGAAFSIFARERVEADLMYPGKMIEWFWKGNGNFLQEKVNFGSAGISANYFREYGLGLAYSPAESPISVGIRAKYYQGLANISTPATFDIDVQTEIENYQLNVETTNAIVRTSGLRILQGNEGDLGSYLLSNGNRGFGIDIGMDYRLNPYYAFSISATDIGFISWNEDIKNREYSDTTFRYVGLQDLNEQNGIIEKTADTVVSILDTDANFDTYTSPTVGQLNASFVYTPIKRVDVITSANMRMVQFQPRMTYGLGIRGYLNPKLIGAASITKLPQQFFNIGVAFAVALGPVQVYASTDKVFGYSVPNMQWVEARVGMNFIFGNGRKKQRTSEDVYEEEYKGFSALQTKTKGVRTGTFMGEKVKVKGQDGIYTIIEKQEPNEPKSDTPNTVNDQYNNRGAMSITGKDSRNERDHRPVESATGTVNKNAGRSRGAPSASGSVNTSSREPIRNQSATGSVNTSRGKPPRNVSATGSERKRGVIRRNRPQSATGTVNTRRGKPPRNVSASGQNRGGKTKRSSVRSATGSTNKGSSKKNKIRSASGKNRNHSSKRRKN
jgi:hypothetical protein